jgi:uncharacterized protein YxeA
MKKLIILTILVLVHLQAFTLRGQKIKDDNSFLKSIQGHELLQKIVLNYG